MYHDFFVHSSVDGHLGCFHALTIVNSAAVDNGMHVSFSILVSSAYRQRFITTKKCDWGKKELKSLIRFHRANKMDNEEGGRKDKSKRIYRTSQSIKNSKCFSWVTAVRILSLAGSHGPPHLPRMPNSVLISGPRVGAAQILIWSYSCVFLPPISTAIRTSLFSFVGALNLLYIP